MTKHSVRLDQWVTRKIVTPSGRPGIVQGVTYDRLDIRFTDMEGGKVSLHPNLLEVTDGKPRPA